MISERFKQRLVGILVLSALAIVFVPVFFNLEPSVPIDETSQIPPAPEIEPVTIAEPQAPSVDYQVPDHESAFRLDSDVVAATGAEQALPSAKPEPSKAPEPKPRAAPPANATSANATPAKKAPEVAPTLAASGLPESWVIQVASFRDAAAAAQMSTKLQQTGHKAFVRQGVSGGNAVHRVYVGPHVLRKSADDEKARIDAAHKVKSLVMRFEP